MHILDPVSATAAATEKTWTTVRVDRNTISASLNALIDGFEHALIEYASVYALCDDFVY